MHLRLLDVLGFQIYEDMSDIYFGLLNVLAFLSGYMSRVNGKESSQTYSADPGSVQGLTLVISYVMAASFAFCTSI